MSRTVVLFGPPGCGKGTQATRLKAALAVPHISTGDMFRDHKKRGTDLGKRVQEIMDAGNLVPDSVTDEMVRERLGRDDVKQGALLDGYPRNVHQAQELERILADNGRGLDDVIVIEVPDEQLVQRIIKRGLESGRKDDQDEPTVRNRMATYHEQSAPCVGHYQSAGKRVHMIDGVGTIDEVTERILESLEVTL
jgi:adenylate kinase